jgi:hypothetical protein
LFEVQPAPLCPDPVFVRRVYLDTIGTLPTGLEARNFILDKNPDKRAVLIERLLSREEFADYWAMKWSDLLRVKAEFPINLWPNAAQAFHHWIQECLRTNLSYDQFARELLTSSGSDFAVPPVNFYRALQGKDPQTIARAVALAFMGARIESWPATQQSNLAAFFSNVGYKPTREWKEEIIFYDPDSTNGLAVTTMPRTAVFPDGTKVELPPGKDPRVVFADWLISPGNRWFARNIVNRAWSWLLGTGIIQEPDDIRPDNPPANPELLAFLEQQLVSSGYDLKQIYRLILNSRTYQQSAVCETPEARESVSGSVPLSSSESKDNAPLLAPSSRREGTEPFVQGRDASAVYYARYRLRRLDAEVLIDAINQVTGSTETYSSAIPEPYTFIPTGERSIALPDGSITSPFLEMFGRPPRDTGLESERNNRISAAQELWLLNSSQMRQKIEKSRLVQYQASSGKTIRANASGLYLQILSRFPTEQELGTIESYSRSSKLGRREATADVVWALMNSDEFLFRH